MTDQTNLVEAADGAESPRQGKQWSRTKALTILAVAWAALGLLTLLVLAGSFWITGLLFDSATGGGATAFLDVAPTLLVFALSSIVFLVGVTSSRGKGDKTDYMDIQVRPVAVIPGVVALTCMASGVLAWQAVGNIHLAATSPILLFIMGSAVIDVHLGPQIRRRCPELWAEAVKRRKSRDKQTEMLGRAFAAVVVLFPVLIIVVIIAKAIFGD